MKRLLRYGAIAALQVLLLVTSARAACENAKDLYEKALNLSSQDEGRVKFLERSAAECDGFAVYLELGKTHAFRNENERALSALRKALSQARDGEEKKLAYQVIGAISQASGKIDEALANYKSALRASPSPEIERALLQLEMAEAEDIVPAERLLSRLNKTRSLAVEGVPQSLDMRIHFDSGAAILSAKGKKQVQELGRMLTSEDYRGKKYKLIGHTDLKGSYEYNDRLSQKRAEAVRRFLTANFAIPSSAISAAGKGKREPLYTMDTEEANTLNRRVEIIIEN